MPRPRKDTGSEPKKRSRTGCWPCKARKVKCGEEKPACANCVKSGEECDYSIRLNWGGRSRKDREAETGAFTFVAGPSPSQTSGGQHGQEHVFSAQHISAGPPRSGFGHFSASTKNGRSASSHSTMPAPNAAPSGPNPPKASPPVPDPQDFFRWSPQHSAKRVRLTPGESRASSSASVFAIPAYPPPVDRSPSAAHTTTYSIGSIMDTPVTPGSSINSASPYPFMPTGDPPPDLRRLSVKSLLSDPADVTDRAMSTPRTESTQGVRYRLYGYDHGAEDMDIPHNADHHVFRPQSPDLRRASAAVSEVSTSSNEVDARLIAFEPGGYYAEPVPIKIPTSLEPLPAELLNNQMNLMYFHHFINHTGRILVPHDCPENPFRIVLPQMAVRNPHLLHLLLSFSASHRSRLLGQPDPQSRIADWMSDVLPALREALDEARSPDQNDPRDPSSLAPLATAIMLAAFEIITPNTFAVHISWQQHLHMARRMIVAKGGLDHLAHGIDGSRDKAIFFLSRWFAYLDVFGSLSGYQHDQPLGGAYLEDGGGRWLVNRADDEIYQIDCFFGFSGRCIALLAQVAELAAYCDRQRIDPVTRQTDPHWRPPEHIYQQGLDLQKRLGASAMTVYRGCTHTNGTYDHAADEIYATNEAYHWAGLIHLARRVLLRPSDHQDVQVNVENVLHALNQVRRGSSAESCLLFPIFAAACEAQSLAQRDIFLERLATVEGWGMHQFSSARRIILRVWEEKVGWETLVEGEFFG